MHENTVDYFEIAVTVVIMAMCVFMLSVIMKEWTVPIMYDTDKSIISITGDFGDDIKAIGKMTGIDVKADLLVIDVNSLDCNRLSIEVKDASGAITEYEIVTLNAEWAKERGANIMKLCADVNSWNLNEKLDYPVEEVYYNVEKDAWIYRLIKE